MNDRWLSLFRPSVPSSTGLQKRFYFEHLQLNSTQLKLSVASAGRLPEDLQSLKSGLGLIIVNLEDATVVLGGYWIVDWDGIGLLQLAITWYKIRHAGGQAHYYSRTGTLKQRDLNQWSLTCLCFDVPVRE